MYDAAQWQQAIEHRTFDGKTNRKKQGHEKQTNDAMGWLTSGNIKGILPPYPIVKKKKKKDLAVEHKTGYRTNDIYVFLFFFFTFEGRFWAKFKWHSAKWRPPINHVKRYSHLSTGEQFNGERISLMGSFFLFLIV